MPLPKDPLKAQLWRERQRASHIGKSINVGESNPFYGKKHTQETRDKISAIHKGRKRPSRSKEWCERISEARKNDPRPENFGVYILKGKRPWVKMDNRGPKNSHWKGGITPENERIRHSPEYTEWRDRVFERDAYTCQNCGFDEGHILRAHHIKPFSTHPELRFDVDNGVTYCKDCHEEHHKGVGNMPPRKGNLLEKFPEDLA